MNCRMVTASLCSLLVIMSGSGVLADEVYSKTEAANRLYKQGKFEEALKLYEDALLLSPADPNLKMNKGSAQYQLGDYDNAEKNYQGALSAKEKKNRATAHYNLGNILFKKGEAMQKKGDMKAQEEYKSALDHYIQSLDLQPSDYDAKWNLQLAHQRIRQMEQQKQQQQQNRNKDRKNDKNDKNNKDQQQQQQQNDQNKNNDRQKKDQQQDQQKNDQQKKEDEQKEREQQQNKVDKKDDKQQPQPAGQQDKDDMKKKDAARIIQLYADDADSLNKPMKKGIGKQQQPEKDW